MRCYVSQFITLIAQHNPVLEGCTGALGRSLCQDLLAQVSSPDPLICSKQTNRANAKL